MEIIVTRLHFKMEYILLLIYIIANLDLEAHINIRIARFKFKSLILFWYPIIMYKPHLNHTRRGKIFLTQQNNIMLHNYYSQPVTIHL